LSGKLKHRVLLLAVSLIAAGTAAAGQTSLPSADEIASAGSFDGQLYTNKALGMTLLAPGGWTFYPYDKNQAVVASNRSKERSLSSANTQVLFQANPPKALSPGRSALFSAGIERLTAPSTAKDYIEANKKLVLSTSSVTVTKDTYSMAIGGVTFNGFDVEGMTNGAPYRQTYLATIRRGAAVFFVSTFYDNKSDVAVAASLKTIKFGK
jgi:hypothetical protein